MDGDTREQRIERFIKETAELPDVPASSRIMKADPRGLLDTIITEAKKILAMPRGG